jgi:hypothetical protein
MDQVLAYSLCLTHFFTLMITLSLIVIPFPIFAQPKLLVSILDHILLLPVLAINDPDAACCNASLVITFKGIG